MSRYSLSFVPCVFLILGVESLLRCNLTLQYTYYDYVLNASCNTSCEFPLLAALTFRDRAAERRELRDPRLWIATAALSATGSFWGEYLDCRLPGHLLICAARVAVNTTVTLQCNGRNGVWPPFPGPFLNETDDDNDEPLIAHPNEDQNEEAEENEDNDLHPDTVSHARLRNASRKPQILNVTETVSQDNHMAKITCIVILLATICVLLCYLPKDDTILCRRDRQSHQSNKRKCTPPYVAIKHI